MKLLPLSEIHIAPDRQRRTFDPKTLQELVEDIRENGLFNAVVLRQVWHPNESGEDLILCQGERRLRAIEDLWSLGGTLRYDGEIIPEGMIPYVTLGDLDPLQAELCELSENLHRDDLTWQERASATAKIMRLRTEIAAQKGEAPPAVSVIAEEVRGSSEGIHHEETRREIILAELMEKDPEIKAQKNSNEAWKLAKRKETTKRNAELAETVGKTFSAGSHTLLNADSINWMWHHASEGKFDIILTDPPYGIGADEFTEGGGGAHDYADDYKTFRACVEAIAHQGFRVTKPQAHLYMFCDIERFYELRALCSSAGWQVHRTPLIWHKPNNAGGIPPWPEHGPRRAYELILYAIKGKKPVTAIAPDVISIPQDLNLGHAAQKPVALYAELLKRSCRPGDQVLDPFAGSGPLLPAAHAAKCIATVIEKDPASYGIILTRAKGLV